MDEDGMEFGANKRGNAKRGRRAQADVSEPTAPPSPTAEDEMVAGPEVNSGRDSYKRAPYSPTPELVQPNAPPKPSRRVGGWGEDSGKRRRGVIDDFEDERLKFQASDNEDSDNDIPVIPDLEDQQEDDMTAQVAVAPNVAVNRVATYRELDHDLLKHAAFLTLDNEIDLKLLTKGLSSEADVAEEDKAWDWDHLFTEVTSELLAEQGEENTEEEKVGA